MMHLCQPIRLPKEEPLRGLIHARFSTEEQRQSSIDGQVASCRTFLESNLPKVWKPVQVVIDVIAEPEVSGEIADRPGINQVWAGIEAKRWHLIIAEEPASADRVGSPLVQGQRGGRQARVFQKPVRGTGHPLRGTTRQRRGLLAGVFNCGVCGSPMYSYGKTDGSFRCSASATGKCWIRVYRMRERVYSAVLEAVVNEVLSLDGVRDAVLARVKELHEKGGAVAAELKKLDKEEKRLLAGIERLSAAAESGDGALSSLTARLAERE